MQVKILKPLALGDGRSPNVNDIIPVDPKIGRSLIQAHLAEAVVEKAILKPKMEVRTVEVVKEVESEPEPVMEEETDDTY